MLRETPAWRRAIEDEAFASMQRKLAPRPNPWEQPLDALLLSLRLNGFEHHAAPILFDGFSLFFATCPRCHEPFALQITEHGEEQGGPITIDCDGGCTEAQVILRLRTLDAARKEMHGELEPEHRDVPL